MADIDDLELELEAPNDNEWDDAKFQRRMDTVANASQNIGALLLQGWTMLAETCDKCHSPLMSQRGSAPQCVVCNSVNKQSNKSKSKSNENTKKPKTDLSAIDESQELKALNDKLWNDKQFEKRMQKSEDASSKIGELLLKGWTMLAEHCSKCQTPLMSLRGGNPMCCICDSNKKKKVAQKQTEIDKSVKQKKDIIPTANIYKRNDSKDNDKNNLERNGFDVEQKKNENYYNYGRHTTSHERAPMNNYGYYPSVPIFGFGLREDEQLRNTLDDTVKIVLDKMNAIKDRMSRNNNSLQNDINELNELMEFLLNVQKFKSQLRR